MLHLGDITKLHGDQIPVVDIITGGSPCQDLSVAGKRAGLDGERSGLFMEQIRIVKEMRERDRRAGRTAWLIRPRFMVWENVPGAFSSNKGRDFQAVLSEIVKIAEPGAPDVPLPEGGRWSKAGCLYSDVGDWSIAWRLHDAQFWGVPQRRKRIALVADFGGLSAPEILFERKGLSGDFEQGGTAGEDATTATESRAGGTGAQCFGISALDSNAMKSSNPHSGIYRADTSRTLDLNGGSPACNQGGMMVVEAVEPLCIEMTSTKNTVVEDGISPTLTARMGTGGNQVNAVQTECVGGDDVAQTLDASYYKGPGNRNGKEREVIAAVDCRNASENATTHGTLQANSNGGISCNLQNVCRTGQTVRRLTPLECERLQGFPDGWTDIGEWVDTKGKKHKPADSPRYKALGNSIALPFWAWLARRICAMYERPVTLGSLFDGIGGFPLVFSRCGAIPVWASEIEEFPIAVTMRHFQEKEG